MTDRVGMLKLPRAVITRQTSFFDRGDSVTTLYRFITPGRKGDLIIVGHGDGVAAKKDDHRWSVYHEDKKNKQFILASTRDKCAVVVHKLLLERPWDKWKQ